MPGSRMKEVRMNLPDHAGVGRELGSRHTNFCCRLRRRWIAAFFNTDRTMHDDHTGSRSTAGPGTLARRNYCQRHRNGGSGNDGTPFVMVYRVSPLTYLLGSPRVKVPHFAMVNLIAGEEIVPELVQHDFTAANVVTGSMKFCPTGRPANTCSRAGRSQGRASSGRTSGSDSPGGSGGRCNSRTYWARAGLSKSG